MNQRYIALVVALASLCGAGWYGYTHWAAFAVLNPAGSIAYQERDIIIITLVLCALVVIPVFIMLFSFAWLYRADHPRAHHHYFPNWDHHTRAAEATWWFVPSAIIVALAFLAWYSSFALDPYRPLPGQKAMTIQVVALNWKWLFVYPEQGIATVNMVEFPENTPVRFELTADAPMNSFWIPQLGGQIMTMPGMSTQLNLMANHSGTFRGLSGNISGAGFSGMTFEAIAVSQHDFDTWVKAIQAMHHPLSGNAYKTLAAPSKDEPVSFYSSVQDNLYTDIMVHYMTPNGTMQNNTSAEETAATMPSETSATPYLNIHGTSVPNQPLPMPQ